MKIVKDGSDYIVKADNFVDLQESEEYFLISGEEGDFIFDTLMDIARTFGIEKTKTNGAGLTFEQEIKALLSGE